MESGFHTKIGSCRELSKDNFLLVLIIEEDRNVSISDILKDVINVIMRA